MTEAGWSTLAESPRLGIVIDEGLVWSPTEGAIGRPFARAIQALASTHVEVFVMSRRPRAVVELLQRSMRAATWVSGAQPTSTSGPESFRSRLSGVPLVVIRAGEDGEICASVVEGAAAPRTLGGSIAVLDFLWWVCRRRGVTRHGSSQV